MHPLDSLFDQFIRDRIYIKNVTPKTRDWYRSVWVAFRASRSSLTPPGTDVLITRSDLTSFIVHLRERGVKPVCCNTWLRAINALPLALR